MDWRAWCAIVCVSHLASSAASSSLKSPRPSSPHSLFARCLMTSIQKLSNRCGLTCMWSPPTNAGCGAHRCCIFPPKNQPRNNTLCHASQRTEDNECPETKEADNRLMELCVGFALRSLKPCNTLFMYVLVIPSLDIVMVRNGCPGKSDDASSDSSETLTPQGVLDELCKRLLQAKL